jgi:hypothetical protein
MCHSISILLIKKIEKHESDWLTSNRTSPAPGAPGPDPDDMRIAEAVFNFGALVSMTSAHHPSEQLEQLRALENGMKIHVILSETSSIGVDTPEDAKEAERLILQGLRTR